MFECEDDCDMIGFCSKLKPEYLAAACYRGGHAPTRCKQPDKMQIRLLAEILAKVQAPTQP